MSFSETVKAAQKLAKLEADVAALKASLPWPPARCETCGRREAKVEKPKALKDAEAKVRAARVDWRENHRTPNTQTMVKEFARELAS